jgi:hypothetical protein
MGSWNGTCAVSNLHVTAGTDVAVFMLLENKEKRSFCYGNALYDVCPIPFYGKYNDYGAVEECYGFGMNLVVEAIRARIYEFGQGPNSCHDTVVNKDNFDIDMLFEADHEDRLGIQELRSWNANEYQRGELEKMRLGNGLTDSQQFELDRLSAKIRQEDTFRQVTHVIIHGEIFKNIMEKWYIGDYVGEGGNAGYDNHYVRVYFKDLVDSIPEYIAKKKKEEDDAKKEDNPVLARIMRRMSRGDEWNSPNLATKWLNYFDSGESNTFGLIRVKEYINDYLEKEDWGGLASFVKEALIGAWVNSFMGYTRKVWTQQSGQGGQSQDADGYILLANTVLDILKAEKAEYDEIMAEDEVEEEAVE